MYQGWRECFASNLWWVQFPPAPHKKNKNMKQMKKSKEVLSGSFDSSKVTRDVNDHVFKFIIRMIKRRKQRSKNNV